MSGAIVTYQKLLNSNETFFRALKEEERISPDTNLRIELIILYLMINYRYGNFFHEQALFINELLYGKYTIEEDKVITEDKTVTIKELRRIIIEMENRKYSKKTQVIPFNKKTSDKVIPLPNRKNNIIMFPYFIQREAISTKDAKRIFSSTMQINEDTKVYVSSARSNYNSLMSRAIITTFNGNISRLDKQIQALLEGHLRIYPLLYSIHSSLDVINDISLPQSNIGISRIKYNNDYVRRKEINIQQLQQQMEKLRRLKKIYENDQNSKEYYYYSKLLSSYENQFIEERFSLYKLSQENEIYNRSLIENLERAISENSIEINNKYRDPIVTFFAIDFITKKANFHCSMHLSTFQNLIPPLEKNQTLKKK